MFKFTNETKRQCNIHTFLFSFFWYLGRSKKGQTRKPRGNCNDTLKLVSSSFETKPRVKSKHKKLLLLIFSLHLVKFDEISTSAVSSVPHLNDFQQKLGVRLHTAANCLLEVELDREQAGNVI